MFAQPHFLCNLKRRMSKTWFRPVFRPFLGLETWLGPVLGTLLCLKTWLGPVLVSSYGPAALSGVYLRGTHAVGSI